jgi:hypothetical protein
MRKISIKLPLKSGLNYEGVWVKELSENTGEINNVPIFTRKYKFGDIIEFDPETGEAVRVVQDGGYAPTGMVKYEGDFQAERKRWEAQGYIVEGWLPGVLGVTRKRAKQGK